MYDRARARTARRGGRAGGDGELHYHCGTIALLIVGRVSGTGCGVDGCCSGGGARELLHGVHLRSSIEVSQGLQYPTTCGLILTRTSELSGSSRTRRCSCARPLPRAWDKTLAAVVAIER